MGGGWGAVRLVSKDDGIIGCKYLVISLMCIFNYKDKLFDK